MWLKYYSFILPLRQEVTLLGWHPWPLPHNHHHCCCHGHGSHHSPHPSPHPSLHPSHHPSQHPSQHPSHRPLYLNWGHLQGRMQGKRGTPGRRLGRRQGKFFQVWVRSVPCPLWPGLLPPFCPWHSPWRCPQWCTRQMRTLRRCGWGRWTRARTRSPQIKNSFLLFGCVCYVLGSCLSKYSCLQLWILSSWTELWHFQWSKSQ